MTLSSCLNVLLGERFLPFQPHWAHEFCQAAQHWGQGAWILWSDRCGLAPWLRLWLSVSLWSVHLIFQSFNVLI